MQGAWHSRAAALGACRAPWPGSAGKHTSEHQHAKSENKVRPFAELMVPFACQPRIRRRELAGGALPCHLARTTADWGERGHLAAHRRLFPVAGPLAIPCPRLLSRRSHEADSSPLPPSNGSSRNFPLPRIHVSIYGIRITVSAYPSHRKELPRPPSSRRVHT